MAGLAVAVAPEVLTASVAPAETVARQALAGPGAAASVLALMVVPVAPEGPAVRQGSQAAEVPRELGVPVAPVVPAVLVAPATTVA